VFNNSVKTFAQLPIIFDFTLSVSVRVLMIFSPYFHCCDVGVFKFSVLRGDGGLKLFRETGLFEDAVGGVTRPDFPIYGKAELSERAVPNFVIPFALTFTIAIIFGKDFFNDRGVVSHFWIRP
jgi:hypothetical protein